MESLKEDMKAKLEQLLEQSFTQLSEMDTRFAEKDQKISLLSDSLTRTTRELEALKAAYAEKVQEISHLQSELQKLKLREEGDPELIIIYQPQDVFKHPREIIRWYFNELDLRKLSFSDLTASMKGLIDLVDCEMLDEFLFHISDDRLTSFKKAELEEILALIESYLQAQLERGFYSPLGIFYFMDSVYQQRWISLLKDFVETNKPYLEDLTFKMDEASFNFKQPLTLLKIYFELQLNLEAKSWLKQIFRSVILTESLELKDAVELLYISLVYEHEESALAFMPFLIKRLPNDSLPELQAFRVYQETYQTKKNLDQALQTLNAVRKEATHLNPEIKNQAFDEMIKRLKLISEEQKIKAQAQIQNAQPVPPKRDFATRTETSSKQFKSVLRIKSGLTSCPYDSTSLKMMNATLAKYTDSNKVTISQYIPVQLLHCPTCNKVYINRSLENNLLRLVSLKQLDIIPYVPEISPNPLNPTNDHYGDKWQEESPLKKLGYSTNLTVDSQII